GPPDPHEPASIKYFGELKAMRSRLNVEKELCFVYDMGQTDEGLIINESMVAELLRASDALFMTSHREGFGMPSLEAGRVVIPIFCTDDIPAAEEIAAGDVVTFPSEASADKIAELILQRMNATPTHRMRQRVRQYFEWHILFQNEIQPLLRGE